jgi:hypothetical protein
MIDQRPHERLDLLIGNQRHLDPARVFQTRGKEVDLRLGAVLVPDPDLAEIVLRKLARQPLEPDQRCDRPDAQRPGTRSSSGEAR